jgi:hypothetical protein
VFPLVAPVTDTDELFADPTIEYFRIFDVMRDYGMYERAEAPQSYAAPAPGSSAQKLANIT